jgi:hypothetical protein
MKIILVLNFIESLTIINIQFINISGSNMYQEYFYVHFHDEAFIL